MVNKEPSQNVPERTYQAILTREYLRRKRRDKAYSQRRFAAELGLSSSRLSEILSFKQGLSLRAAEDLAHRLALEGVDRVWFLTLVRAADSRSAADRRQAQNELHHLDLKFSYRDIPSSKFGPISEWWHFAILETTKLHGFEPTLPWIAKKLGLSETTVEQALMELQSCGLARKVDEKWSFAAENAEVPSGASREAVQNFHRRVLTKATNALQLPVEKRDYRSTLFAFDFNRLNELRDRIDEFWRSVDREFGTGSKLDQIVFLSIQVFPASENIDA